VQPLVSPAATPWENATTKNQALNGRDSLPQFSQPRKGRLLVISDWFLGFEFPHNDSLITSTPNLPFTRPSPEAKPRDPRFYAARLTNPRHPIQWALHAASIAPHRYVRVDLGRLHVIMT
jgi:hypothetical protein